jgi:hypothetical protein
MNELNKKLSVIQQKLKAPKGQFNKFGNFYYRSCEDILEAVKPLLGDMALTISDEVVCAGDRYYVRATAILYDGVNSIMTNAFAREALDKKGMDDAQITGSASSYARKYALNGLFAIDDTQDADTKDNSKKVEDDLTVFDGEVVKDIDEKIKKTRILCSSCGHEITPAIDKFSNKVYGKSLCMTCQTKEPKKETK